VRSREYVSAGGVVIDGDKMLLLDRPSRGEVRLPKGHVDPGEIPEQTALREVQEETGIGSLEILEDLGERTVEFEYDAIHYRRVERYFLMRRTGSELVERPPKDAKQFQPVWIPLDEAPDMLTYAAEQDVALRAIAAYRTPAS
jgi:8-oxo-dGTP pyrophosphatase MutT (NUDIX family)